MEKVIIKFEGELKLLGSELDGLLEFSLDTKEKKQTFLFNTLNSALDAQYPDNIFDIDVRIID